MLQEPLRVRDIGDIETSFDHIPGKLICKHSISSDHWGSGVYIELQMMFPWLAWGLGKKHPTAFGQGVLFFLPGMNGSSQNVLIHLPPSGFVFAFISCIWDNDNSRRGWRWKPAHFQEHLLQRLEEDDVQMQLWSHFSFANPNILT